MTDKLHIIIACASVLLSTSAGISVGGQYDMTTQSMRRRIMYLSSDELAGRAPGSKGEKLTLEFLAKEFETIGCSPGNPDGTYFQSVPLVGLTVTNRATLDIAGESYTRSLAYGPEYMGWSLHQKPAAAISDAELVFVGYGVVAPEYDWNDYEGVDVTGKVAVMLVGDPPHPNESMFGGRAMTYYGRWTYKFETAAEKGAAGAILVHNREAAGYPWAVVENSWAGEQFDVVREDAGMSQCAIESWITEDVARDLFGATGRSYDEEKVRAISDGFHGFSMGLRASLALEIETRAVSSNNVVARIEGGNERLKNEHVIYTAHWDHFGTGNAVDGDSIYNGALDNASGVAGVLEIAQGFAGRRSDLKRSVLFILTTAEESGLLGARHYAEHPLYPLQSTVANINIDGLNVWGRTQDMVVVGHGQSDLDRTLEDVCTTLDRYIIPDSEPEKGFYYRSDHFEFAKKGVPALYADSGVEFRNRPEGWGMERRNEYVQERYHKPQDEYDAAWDLTGALEDMLALFLVGHQLAVSDRYPRWNDSSEFKRVREESLGGRR